MTTEGGKQRRSDVQERSERDTSARITKAWKEKETEIIWMHYRICKYLEQVLSNSEISLLVRLRKFSGLHGFFVGFVGVEVLGGDGSEIPD